MNRTEWLFLDCKECHVNSLKDWSYRPKPKDPSFEENKFKLCAKCSEAIEKLKRAD